MGMFDEIRCDAELPDGGATSDVYFQTKTFPWPCMQRYVITRTGRLVDSAGNDLEPEGYIIFYTTEVDKSAASSGHRSWREYRAQFASGQLRSIVRVEEGEEAGRVYFGLASFRWFDTPSFLFGDPSE